MVAVALRGLKKTFPPDVIAVDGADLDIADGEWLALVGPSGCGKTTTLRLVAGLEQPAAGTICLGGCVVNDVPPHRRNVAMLFQRPALLPHRTVLRNLTFSDELKRPFWRVRTDQMPAVAMASILGLRDYLERYPAELSGGQQQRLALGRALLRRAGVCLLDEPFAQLDVSLRWDLRRQLHLLRKQSPATMVYVTHDPAEAMALGDRVAVMQQGRVLQVGRPHELYARPAHRQVAQILGHQQAPWSFLDGVIERQDGSHCLVGREVKVAVPDAWARYVDREVTVGLRPESVVPRRVADGGYSTLEATATAAEAQGGRWWVQSQVGGWGISAFLPDAAWAHTIDANVKLTISWRWSDMVLFDRKTGQALPLDG